jgi:outer membrane receptor for ferric coprogen and ferric-rhodotorulic acid
MQLQSNFNLGKRFEFDQGYRFVSALPAQNVNAYQTMDARIACDFTKNWNLSLVGQNLFQRYHYEWGTGDPTQQLIGIKRAAYLKLTWTP